MTISYWSEMILTFLCTILRSTRSILIASKDLTVLFFKSKLEVQLKLSLIKFL